MKFYDWIRLLGGGSQIGQGFGRRRAQRTNPTLLASESYRSPEVQTEQGAHDAEFQRAAELGIDPFADRSGLTEAQRTYIMTGRWPDEQIPASPSGGTTGAGQFELPTWIFEGNVYRNFIDYINAMGEAIDRELSTDIGRAREESGRTRSRFLEELGKQEQKGQADLGSYYSNLGDIYQSSEGIRRTGLEQEVGQQRATGLQDIDRALNDYIQGRTTAAKEQRGGTFQSVAEMRDQLARNPGARFNQVDPTGRIQLSDTSSLLAQLNSFLQPEALRRRYQGGNVNPINQYLNP